MEAFWKWFDEPVKATNGHIFAAFVAGEILVTLAYLLTGYLP